MSRLTAWLERVWYGHDGLTVRDVIRNAPRTHSHGSFAGPCRECGVQLYGEGLPSVNWRRGVPFSYCPECLTEQHNNFRSAILGTPTDG